MEPFSRNYSLAGMVPNAEMVTEDCLFTILPGLISRGMNAKTFSESTRVLTSKNGAHLNFGKPFQFCKHLRKDVISSLSDLALHNRGDQAANGRSIE